MCITISKKNVWRIVLIAILFVPPIIFSVIIFQAFCMAGDIVWNGYWVRWPLVPWV